VGSQRQRGNKFGVIGVVSGLIGLIAVAAAFKGNITTLGDWWCGSVGFYCTFAVTGEVITVSSGGGEADLCQPKVVDACIRPSTPHRALVTGSTTFRVTDRSAGVFIDGTPSNANPVGTSNIGWFHPQPANDTAERACVKVFARTSACETSVSIKGHMEAMEANK
jgi:hypothetical protein